MTSSGSGIDCRRVTACRALYLRHGWDATSSYTRDEVGAMLATVPAGNLTPGWVRAIAGWGFDVTSRC